MSDYTLTPNLGLYKPTFNADVSNWGQHWNANADTLDSVVTGLGAGPFLPLAGGTLTGPLTVPSMLVGGTALGGKTRFEFNPTNPGGTGAALFMNRQASSDGQTQIRSNLRVDYAAAGSTAARNVMLETIQTTNAKDVWPILNRSYTNANTDAGTHVGMFSLQLRNGVLAGGTGGVAMWCHVMEARSQTGLPSSQDGIMQPLEVDIFANGLDDRAPSIGRTAISVVIGKDNPAGAECEVTHGISFYGATGVYKRMIGAAATFNQSVLDTRSAVAVGAANAIWLASGHKVALDTAGTVTLRWDSATSRVKLAFSGVDKVSIDATGNIRAAGTVTGSTTP